MSRGNGRYRGHRRPLPVCKSGEVRIIAGKYKGKKFKTPGEGTHPMGERERNAMFNMIKDYLPEAVVLDAYAGSGVIGLEALSRGAEYAIFVDTNPRAVEMINDVMGDMWILNFRGNAQVRDMLEVARTVVDEFSIVFADPPYDKYKPEMITALSRLVAKDGILIASTPEEGPEIEGMEKIKSQKYARAHISVYRWKCWAGIKEWAAQEDRRDQEYQEELG